MESEKLSLKYVERYAEAFLVSCRSSKIQNALDPDNLEISSIGILEDWATDAITLCNMVKQLEAERHGVLVKALQETIRKSQETLAELERKKR